MPEVEPALLATADLERVHGAFQIPSVEWSQLERGPYRGDLCFIEFRTIRVFREGFSLGVRRHGTLGLERRWSRFSRIEIRAPDGSEPT